MSSPTTQEFSTKNRFEEENKKEEGGEDNMEGFIRKSNEFLPMNLPNPKEIPNESLLIQKKLKEKDEKLQV